MTRNYGTTSIPGQTRTRVWRATGENPLGYPPTLTVHEHTIVRLVDGSEAVVGRDRDITMTMDPDKAIPIRHPDTDAVGAFGSLPESLTMAECFAVIRSLARLAQTEQDAVEEAVEEAAITEGSP